MIKKYNEKYKLSEKNKQYSLSQPNGVYLLKNGKPLYHWINDDEKIINELNKISKENEYIKTTIQSMMESERTEIGQNVLKQLWEVIQ